MPRTNGACGMSGSNIEPLRSMGTIPCLEKGGLRPSHQKVLIIDDDVDLCELLAESLRRQGFLVLTVHDGITGLVRALSNEFALIVLDLMLPGLDGSEVLNRIRSRSNVPVIILTAKGEANDRIVGLEGGADDYVAKPIHPRELSARMQAVLRRAPTDGSRRKADHIEVGDIEVNTRARTARRRNRLIDLTSVEFDLLVLFLKSPGFVLGREELSQAVLGRELRANDRSIDVHVSNLRRKLGPNSSGSERLKNIRSTGYLYVLLP
jgi:two-component system response regulator CpxR